MWSVYSYLHVFHLFLFEYFLSVHCVESVLSVIESSILHFDVSLGMFCVYFEGLDQSVRT